MTFTREQLQQIIETDHVQCGDAAALARELLESRVDADQHIRREVNVGGNTWVQCSNSAFEKAKSEGKHVRELYERPQPAPVVPDEISTTDAMRMMNGRVITMSVHVAYKNGWNACRAAMLQGGKS